ncbi:MAG: hypothetical protein ACFB4J_09430 [Elainellaceae cyanobacterium]
MESVLILVSERQRESSHLTAQGAKRFHGLFALRSLNGFERSLSTV